MTLMVTIQLWVFNTTCWSRQYDFNLVHHLTTEKQIFSYSEKNIPRQDLNRGSRPQIQNIHKLYTAWLCFIYLSLLLLWLCISRLKWGFKYNPMLLVFVLDIVIPHKRFNVFWAYVKARLLWNINFILLNRSWACN